MIDTPAFDGELAAYEQVGLCELIFVSTRTGPYNLYCSLVTSNGSRVSAGPD